LKLKYPIILNIGLIIVIIGSFMIINQVNAQYSNIIQVNTTFKWYINKVTDKPVSFYESGTWNFLGKMVASEGTFAEYTIIKITNSKLYGKFIMGNLTLNNLSTYDIGMNLVLGINSWNPGFISITNWTLVRIWVINNCTGLFNGTINISEDDHSFRVYYMQGANGDQNVTLIFDKLTGILLYGYAEFGNYYLEIIYYPQIATSSTQFIGIETLVFIIPTISIIIAIFAFAFKKYNKKLIN